MTWEAFHAAAEEANLWLGLAVNVWVIVTGIIVGVVALRRHVDGLSLREFLNAAQLAWVVSCVLWALLGALAYYLRAAN
jgi:hypothetical protein